MKYSLTQGGILVALLGAALAPLAFSDSCSSEIVDKLLPVLGALPGLVTAWIGRYKAGGVTLAGWKKR